MCRASSDCLVQRDVGCVNDVLGLMRKLQTPHIAFPVGTLSKGRNEREVSGFHCNNQGFTSLILDVRM